MSYHSGIGQALANATGTISHGPYITCDDCGNVLSVHTKRGDVAQWFMCRRNPPGWQLTYKTDGGIWAHCPACLKHDA